MEILLAIVVASAVIFFGALISMGNERQKSAIDDLREQVSLWAMQDLQIKREHIAREVKVENPQIWLNSKVSRLYGRDIDLQIIESFDQPAALSCISGDTQCKFVFSLLSPSDIVSIRKSSHNRLNRYSDHNPLLSLPKSTVNYELTMLNSGMLFDQELAIVWKILTGTESGTANRLWIYKY